MCYFVVIVGDWTRSYFVLVSRFVKTIDVCPCESRYVDSSCFFCW